MIYKLVFAWNTLDNFPKKKRKKQKENPYLDDKIIKMAEFLGAWQWPLSSHSLPNQHAAAVATISCMLLGPTPYLVVLWVTRNI